MTDTKAILVRARILISDPKSWLQGKQARTGIGTSARACSRRAQSFCVVGALRRAAWELDPGLSPQILRGLIEDHLPPNRGAEDWNDAPRRTHAQVLRLLDKAIAAESRISRAPPRSRTATTPPDQPGGRSPSCSPQGPSSLSIPISTGSSSLPVDPARDDALGGLELIVA